MDALARERRRLDVERWLQEVDRWAVALLVGVPMPAYVYPWEWRGAAASARRLADTFEGMVTQEALPGVEPPPAPEGPPVVPRVPDELAGRVPGAMSELAGRVCAAAAAIENGSPLPVDAWSRASSAAARLSAECDWQEWRATQGGER